MEVRREAVDDDYALLKCEARAFGRGCGMVDLLWYLSNPMLFRCTCLTGFPSRKRVAYQGFDLVMRRKSGPEAERVVCLSILKSFMCL